MAWKKGRADWLALEAQLAAFKISGRGSFGFFAKFIRITHSWLNYWGLHEAFHIMRVFCYYAGNWCYYYQYFLSYWGMKSLLSIYKNIVIKLTNWLRFERFIRLKWCSWWVKVYSLIWFSDWLPHLAVVTIHPLLPEGMCLSSTHF